MVLKLVISSVVGIEDPLVPEDFTPVGGATGEQNLAAFLSTMEASGNQNQADAFQ